MKSGLARYHWWPRGGEISLPVGSVDILAFSRGGDIALCECKLARNTQANREVMGQILDYAAHLWEMSYEDFDQKIKERQQVNLADWMREVLKSPEWDEENFQRIRENLNNGNFILVIAVNEINEESSRIVRYVNTTGNPGYAFAALEMRRFRSGEIEMLVPRCLDQCALFLQTPSLIYGGNGIGNLSQQNCAPVLEKARSKSPRKSWNGVSKIQRGCGRAKDRRMDLLYRLSTITGSITSFRGVYLCSG